MSERMEEDPRMAQVTEAEGRADFAAFLSPVPTSDWVATTRGRV